ncbi:hypothetical protein ACTP13_25080 [Paenibacillus peoriae]|uniref:hypothetical protein n=1 Tax=Paenibacillus peoriae TaxID=59893 RepID=UPI003F991608
MTKWKWRLALKIVGNTAALLVHDLSLEKAVEGVHKVGLVYDIRIRLMEEEEYNRLSEFSGY